MLLFDYYFTKPAILPSFDVTSVYYLAFIFAASLLLYFINNLKIKNCIIFCFSLFFIWTFSKDYYFVVVSLLVCLYGYIFSFIIKKHKNKLLYTSASLILILVLILFKEGFLSKSLLVPLGISFYILRLVWYFNYLYNGKIEIQKNFFVFSNYLIFFPSYIAGPIEKPTSFFDEINKNETPSYLNIKKGWIRLLYGIFEKIVICDFFGQIVEMILPNSEITGPVVFIGILLYSFQIYLDFDSYSNIALGSASIIGVELNENFKTPYLSKNIKEFWNRWHISLSTWLKENVYIPLGGNKKGSIRKIINVILVFVASGIWHGVALHYILWGLFHALLRIIEDLIEKIIGKSLDNIVISFFRVLINFIIVSLTWLLFRYESISEISTIFARINISSDVVMSSLLTHNEYLWMCALLIFVVIIDLLRYKINIYNLIAKFYFPFRLLIYFVFIVVFLIFGVYGGSIEASDFIYRWF